MKSFKTLKPFFIEHKWNYILGALWLISVDIVQLLVPQILRTVTNLLQEDLLTTSSLIKYGILIMITGLTIAIGRYFWRIYIQGTSRTLEYYLRNKLFNHLLGLSTNYFNTQKTGDLMAHATNDINAIRMALGPGLVALIDATFITILAIAMMIKTTNLKLTLIALITLPFIALIVGKFGNLVHKRFRIVQEAFSQLTDTTQENFAGIRVIKSFVQEENEIKRFTHVNQYNLEKNLELVKVSGTFHPLVQFLASISFLIIIWYGGTLVMMNEISLGDFIAFNSYLSLLIWPMMAIGWVINLLERGSASMERINNILREEPEILEVKNPIELKNVKGDIEFSNVSFKYPNSKNYALKDIDINIPSGSTTAIIGRTGSGKTTLINLLLRLYDIDEGEIFVDGKNIRNTSLKSLRENIGYVPQDNFLFSTTIKENIAFPFDSKYYNENIYKAAKIAEVYDNIVEFPNKFETVLGERGVTLSGGQKQRVSIARAVVKKSPILIFDDSFSSVDTETEEKILNNLKTITERITTIIISHRISTVKNSDQIIVLDDGMIIERGNHDTLLKLDGLYKDIYEKQLLEEKLKDIN